MLPNVCKGSIQSCRIAPNSECCTFSRSEVISPSAEVVGRWKNPLEWGWAPTRTFFSENRRDAAPELFLKFILYSYEEWFNSECSKNKAELLIDNFEAFYLGNYLDLEKPFCAPIVGNLLFLIFEVTITTVKSHV